MVHTLESLVNAAIAMYPAEEARIRRGAEIVDRDGVRPPCDEHPMHRVGIHHWYPVNGHCPCPDAAYGNAPEGRCKHRYALSLYRKLKAFQSLPPLRSLKFVASLGDVHGIAQVWEDGRILLRPYDTDQEITCQWHEIVLGGRVDLMA